MYTRNYQIKKEPPKTIREEAELPLIEDQAESICDGEPLGDGAECVRQSEASNLEMRKRRYRAVRLPRFKDPTTVLIEPCEKEGCEDREDVCSKPQVSCKEHERTGLLRSFSSDELFILALIVLLICEGGDDILILALCFIIS